jgi:trimethyllysine dioxygenase
MASDEGVGKWTAKIWKHGFCYVDGCPVDPQKTQELLERIAFIRITHYGESLQKRWHVSTC